MADQRSASAHRNRAERRHLAPDLTSIPDASRRLGIHPDSGYRLARAGKFPGAIQIGSRWLVSIPRLERHLHGDEAS